MRKTLLKHEHVLPSFSRKPFQELRDEMENVHRKLKENHHYREEIDEKIAETVKTFFREYKNSNYFEFIEDMNYAQGTEKNDFPLHYACRHGFCLSVFELLPSYTSIPGVKSFGSCMIHLENDSGQTALFEVIKHF